MPVLVLLVATGLLFLLQRKIYEKNWSKGLDIQVDMGKDQFIFEGSSIHVEEILSNNKLLPLPWVCVKYQLSVNGRPTIYCGDMFSILFRQRIRRRRSFTLKERGVYTLSSVDLVSHDLFLTKTLSKVATDRSGMVTVYPQLLEQEEWPLSYKQMMGEVITKRFSIEDPYLFKGIRDYQSTDSFRDLNFHASARAGKWMVNVHEFTISQKVTILLGMDKGSDYYDPALYEYALRIAGTLAVQYENEGIPVGFYTNGIDALMKKEVEVGAGCGTEHICEMLEALARINIDKEDGTILSRLRQGTENANSDTFYILVTPCCKKEIREAYEEFYRQQKSCMWIMPITPSQHEDPEFAPRQWENEVPGFCLWQM